MSNLSILDHPTCQRKQISLMLIKNVNMQVRFLEDRKGFMAYPPLSFSGRFTYLASTSSILKERKNKCVHELICVFGRDQNRGPSSSGEMAEASGGGEHDESDVDVAQDG